MYDLPWELRRLSQGFRLKPFTDLKSYLWVTYLCGYPKLYTWLYSSWICWYVARGHKIFNDEIFLYSLSSINIRYPVNPQANRKNNTRQPLIRFKISHQKPIAWLFHVYIKNIEILHVATVLRIVYSITISHPFF